MTIPSKVLISGAKMPMIGFGTWQLAEGDEAESSVRCALQAGYRLIDTAKIYGNERSVGLAVDGSGLSRQEIYITTKLWTSDFTSAQLAFNNSLERLGMDYVDLYLIHWPNGSTRQQAWEALSELYAHGKAKAIGVSNYKLEHLEELFHYSDILPAVNQIELHPFNYHQQRPMLELCMKKGIVVQAYSPLAAGRQMENETIGAIAKTRQKSPAQIMLRWAIQHGAVPIPKSATPKRICQNINVFDFELIDEDMAALDDLS